MCLLLAVMLLGACSTVPVTERRQLSLIPSDQILSLSFQQYDKFLSEHKVVTGTSESRMVKEVGKRISQAVEDYMRKNGQENLLQGYAWEFNLVEDKQANAFCMPGGKVVVYTGILPITKNESGLATVMGHEIAHAIARHGNERMSQALATQLGGMALSVALSSEPQQTRQLFMQAYGLGAQVGVLLPYSRLQESEADEIGLIFMAKAGYDPRKAVDFWQRMEKQSGGGAPPEFLSTHPSPKSRIEDIKEHLPEAMKYYRK
jgi:predicted Zn-dependent protease